jgi:hypothetical protein
MRNLWRGHILQHVGIIGVLAMPAWYLCTPGHPWGASTRYRLCCVPRRIILNDLLCNGMCKVSSEHAWDTWSQWGGINGGGVQREPC